jgi:hypothetical protein
MAGGEASRARLPTAVATHKILGRAARQILETMRSLADPNDVQEAIHQIDQCQATARPVAPGQRC